MQMKPITMPNLQMTIFHSGQCVVVVVSTLVSKSGGGHFYLFFLPGAQMRSRKYCGGATSLKSTTGLDFISMLKEVDMRC